MKANSLLVVLAYILMASVFLGLVQRVLLPWSYIILSMLIGITFAVLLFQSRGKMHYLYPLIIALAILLWSIYYIATSFSVIAFYDAYGEFIFAKILGESGHFSLNMPWHFPPPTNPTNPSGYPLFSILSVSLELVTGIDLLHTAIFMPFINGLVALLFTALFIKLLLDRTPIRNAALPLALLFFAISPDAIYTAMHFYHRHYSLALCFMMLYLILKTFYSERLRRRFVALLVFSILVLPLSYSYYFTIYTVFLFWFTVFACTVSPLLKKKKATGISIKLSWRIFFLAFAGGSLWNFIVIYPNPLTSAFRRYIWQLVHPAFRSVEVEKFEQMAVYSIPHFLKPEPFLYLLWVRDVALWTPMLVYSAILLYQLVVKRDCNIKASFPLYALASFAPLIILNFFAGGWGSLQWRFYAMPLIVYFAAIAYTLLLRHKFLIVKVFTSGLVVLLIFLAFLSPFSHIYFPLHLYDSTIGFREVGHPSPAYINLKSFINEHPFGQGRLLSDRADLLFTIMEPEDYRHIGYLLDHFGESNTYIVEFIEFRPPLGYSSPEYIQKMTEIRSQVCFEYSKLLDSGYYGIYYKGS